MTNAPERSDKFTYVLDPKSGADIWLKAPVDKRGRPIFPDLHINVDWAEDLILELSLAIEEKRKEE